MPDSNTVREITAILKSLYPNAQTELEYRTPFQLLVATILSAQCTDQRVNMITRRLFQDHPSVEDIAQLSLGELEEYIRSAGLWQTKARSIKNLPDLDRAAQRRSAQDPRGTDAASRCWAQDGKRCFSQRFQPARLCRGYPRPPGCEPFRFGQQQKTGTDRTAADGGLSGTSLERRSPLADSARAQGLPRP